MSPRAITQRLKSGATFISSLLIMFSTVVCANMSPGAPPQVDYLALSADLLKDGYIERAKQSLKKVDITPANFDFAHFYTLVGILYHKQSFPTLSNIYLHHAMSQGQDKPSVHIYIARNHWMRRDYPAVIDSLDAAGDAALEIEQLYVIKAEAYRETGNLDQSWSTLDAGIEKFPEYSRFYKQKFHYLVDLGLYQQAQTYIERFLQAGDYTADDYLTISFALRQNQNYEMAAVLLEEARLKHPEDDRIVELLSQIYIDLDSVMSAALVQDWASLQSSNHAVKAAALYLKAKEPIRALQLNRRVADQTEKYRQRLSISLLLEDYESVAAMDKTLNRYGLLKEDDIAYAVGFAHYVNRDFGPAKRLLKTIEDRQLFGKAAYIFQQIERCEYDPLECR